MEIAKRANILFTIRYQSGQTGHEDRLLVNKIDFWRDILPGDMKPVLENGEPERKYVFNFPRGQLLGERSWDQVKRISKKLLHQGGETISLKNGRFYPSSLIWQMINCYPGDQRPFRVTHEDDHELEIDRNHPLANFDLEVEGRIIDFHAPAVQRGGSINDLAELLTENGPGMQVVGDSFQLEGYADYPYQTRSTISAKAFYQNPRMIDHLDRTALDQVQEFYSSILTPEMRILDLMSSFNSHLPENYRGADITGIGMNESEMQQNRLLREYHRQDLNQQPSLHFPEHSFEAIICTVSIEYLTRPREVVQELNRILVPGGRLAIVISDRWFPDQEISFWPDLHPFERQGFVLGLLQKSGGLENFKTLSIRGLPRPYEDKYSDRLQFSDPVFAVWAQKSG